jgi:hypothetical protein
MRPDTISLGSHQWTSIDLPFTTVTLHRCTLPAAGPLLAGIRASYYINLYLSPPSQMVAMGILPTVTIPTSLPLGRSDPRQRRLPLSRVASPLECLRIPTTLPNVHLPPASVTLRGPHELIQQRSPIETLDVRIENGIENAATGICKSIPALLLINCLVLESTPLLIAVTALVPALLVTTAHLSHLQGLLISQPLVGRILPRGPRINLLHLVLPLLNPSPSPIRLGDMILGTMVEILGN